MIILSKESKQVVYKMQRTVEGVRCDVCGRIIPALRLRKPESKYFEVQTGHNDWGNDSCESIKRQDICPECVGAFVTSYLGDANGSEYLEVETKHCWPRDTYVDD